MEANGLRVERRQLALRKRAEYTAVYERGRNYANRLLTLKVAPTPVRSDLSRFGYSVSKTVGKAVVRNRVRRRLKEIARLAGVRPGWDIVLIARSSTALATYGELKEAALGLMEKARLTEVQDKRLPAQDRSQ